MYKSMENHYYNSSIYIFMHILTLPHMSDGSFSNLPSYVSKELVHLHSQTQYLHEEHTHTKHVNSAMSWSFTQTSQIPPTACVFINTVTACE